jgi:hypothetical protein
MMPETAAKIGPEPGAKLGPGADHRVIYRAIYYFNLFDYPVRVEELASFSGLSLSETTAAVSEMTSGGLIDRRGDFVLIPNREWIIGQRVKGESYFLQHYKRIKLAAWFLSHMPFVRGIILTGRTSKGLLSEYDDFDFLILARKGRARITWILLFLLRRLVSLNFRNANFKWFCCNYVLGEEALALQDRDVFIAMELACAFPVFNRPLFEKFLQANAWRTQYFHERGNRLPADLTFTFRLGIIQWLLEIPCNLLWRGRVRRAVEDYYRRRWLKLGIVKDEEDYRQKASDAYVKPDTGGRRKFIVERAERLDPTEHQSFLRTKTNLHRALTRNADTPQILLMHAGLRQAASSDTSSGRASVPARSVISGDAKSEPTCVGCNNEHETTVLAEPFAAAEHLRKCGYRAEYYDTTSDASLVEVFRCVKTRLIPLVGIYVLESTRGNACRMIELFHGIGARVIVAGPDASTQPQLYLDGHADIVITKDHERAILGLLQHIYQGSVALEAIPGTLY